MKSTFTIAAVVGTASANPQQLNKMANNPGFQGFMSQNNKHYTTVGEMRLRAQIYSENDDEIRRLNAKSAATGKPNAAQFGHNNFSDMTAQEFQATHLGLKNKDPALAVTNMPQHGWGGGRNNMMSQGRGRGLVADATTVDHAKDGFMGPVKQQGNCGSCWAFAANSQLEGAIAKKNNTSPVRLSEQQLVDCTLRNNARNQDLFGKDYGLWGCGGGWMDTAWTFQKEQGIMTGADYGYTSGNTGRETACAHDTSKTIGNVTNIGQIRSSIDDVKAKLRTHPLTIAVDAGGSVFQFYKSGVVGANDGCGTGLNHAVVVVGYTEAGDDGSDDRTPDPQPDPTPTPDPTPDPTPVDDECTVYKWWHSCQGNSRRRLQDANGYENYWKIQNSWGTGWGDQGFILFEISDGPGVCGMNSYIEWAEM